MPYTITKSDGTTLATLQPQTINTSAASIALVGQGFIGYGQYLNNDLVHILENFASTQAPGNPLAGQLWWDKGTDVLRVYDGAEWIAVRPDQGPSDAGIVTVEIGSQSVLAVIANGDVVAAVAESNIAQIGLPPYITLRENSTIPFQSRFSGGLRIGVTIATALRLSINENSDALVTASWVRQQGFATAGALGATGPTGPAGAKGSTGPTGPGLSNVSNGLTLQNGTLSVSIIPPSAASNLLASNVSTNSVYLSWTAPSTGTAPFDYEIHYRMTGVDPWFIWGTTSNTSANITSLASTTKYEFRIATTNGFGPVAFSTSTQITTLGTAPSAPTLTVGTLTSNSASLSWTVPSSGSTPFSYIVQYRVHAAANWTPLPSTSATSTTVTGLATNTQYDFEVIASNNTGSATSTAVSGTTAAAATVAPAAPTSLTSGTITSTSIQFSWTAPATGTSPFTYEVDYKLSTSGTWIKYGSVTTTSATVPGLTASTNYDFRVIASNSAGSATSSTATFTTISNSGAATGTVSGTQTSGNTAPVIAGPSSGNVSMSQQLAITGITITDSFAAGNPGTCALNLSCTYGTLSTSVNNVQVSGSGTASINYVNTFSNCQTAAANLLYVAPSSSGMDNVIVQLWDQSGANNEITIPISIPAVTGVSITPISDTSGTTASMAKSLTLTFGMNTHIDFASYGYQNLSQFENAINYVWGKSGSYPILRDCPQNTGGLDDATLWAQVSQATGCKFLAYIGETTSSNYYPTLQRMQTIMNGSHCLMGIEGPNEEDTFAANGGGSGSQYTELQNAANFMPTVWSMGQTLSLPVFNMSFGQGWGSNYDPTYTHGNYGIVGSTASYCTYANAHTYPVNGFSPQENSSNNNGSITMLNSAALLAAPGRPVAITEFGYQLTGSGGSVIPRSGNQTDFASYALIGLMDAWKAGNKYWFWYALFDDATGTWGWFDTSSSAYVPRKVATAFRNFLWLMADYSTSFAPSKLDFTLTNMPSGTDSNDGGQSALFQKTDGSYWLVLWNEQKLTTDILPVSVTLTLNEFTATSIIVYDPMIGDGQTYLSMQVQTLSNATTATINLPTYPIVVEIVR